MTYDYFKKTEEDQDKTKNTEKNSRLEELNKWLAMNLAVPQFVDMLINWVYEVFTIHMKSIFVSKLILSFFTCISYSFFCHKQNIKAFYQSLENVLKTKFSQYFSKYKTFKEVYKTHTWVGWSLLKETDNNEACVIVFRMYRYRKWGNDSEISFQFRLSKNQLSYLETPPGEPSGKLCENNSFSDEKIEVMLKTIGLFRRFVISNIYRLNMKKHIKKNGIDN